MSDKDQQSKTMPWCYIRSTCVRRFEDADVSGGLKCPSQGSTHGLYGGWVVSIQRHHAAGMNSEYDYGNLCYV